MNIAELQQALHSVALKGSLNAFSHTVQDTSPIVLNSAFNASIVSQTENGLQLTLF